MPSYVYVIILLQELPIVVTSGCRTVYSTLQGEGRIIHTPVPHHLIEKTEETQEKDDNSRTGQDTIQVQMCYRKCNWHFRARHDNQDFV